MTSVIAAPLIVRGELLGVMSLALSGADRAATSRHYDADDRDLVGAIASRVAIAIDNAMLFEEERRTALAFQNSLLPDDAAASSTAWRWPTGTCPPSRWQTHGQGIQTQVGGDWYDVIPLSAGRVGIVIGDVEGRGAGRPPSWASSGPRCARSPRTTSRPPTSCAGWTSGAGPSARRRAGARLRRRGPAHVPAAPTSSTTPGRGRCPSPTPGTTPPLLRRRGRRRASWRWSTRACCWACAARASRGVPTYKEETRTLPPGATLVLYTDGLTDRRSRAGRRRPLHRGRGARRCSAQAVQAAATASVEAIAAAAETRCPATSTTTWRSWWSAPRRHDLDAWERTLPGRADHGVRGAADGLPRRSARWGMDGEQAELACLLVSEVVTNVVLHAAATQPRRSEFRAGDRPARPARTAAGRVVRRAARRARRGRRRPGRRQGVHAAAAPRRERGLGRGVRRGPAAAPDLSSAARTTRAAAACTWWTSWPAGGGPGRPEDGKAVWFEMPLRGASAAG